LRTIGALLVVIGGLVLPLGVATPTIANASAATEAQASKCPGSPGHGIYDATTGKYVNLAGVGGYKNRLVANSVVDAKQWSIYLDNQPTSPEYGEYALCNVNNGHWMTWNNDNGTTILRADATTPWRSPRHTFFTDPWCGKAPDGKFLMDFANAGESPEMATTINFDGESAEMAPSHTNEDWFTVDGMCGVP
jgi:hypothetical protein